MIAVAGRFTLAVLLLSPGVARPLCARQATPPAAPDSLSLPKRGCIQGDPLPGCASFWILEIQRSTTLVEPSWIEPTFDGGTAVATADHAIAEWTLGYMWNRSEAWAFGGTVSLGTHAQGAVTGARFRARRWLTPTLSLSTEMGLARSTARMNAFETGIGPSMGLRIDVGDYLSGFVRYDRIEARPRSPVEPLSRLPKRHEYLRIGLGVGGKAALIATGAMAVGVAALAALIGNSWT